MTRNIIRTVTTAIAIAAIAAPTALARPADMPPAVAKAAEQHKQARQAQENAYPTRPAQGEQANPRPDTTTTVPPSAPAERDIAWTTIAAGMLALAAIGATVRHTRRSGRARVSA